MSYSSLLFPSKQAGFSIPSVWYSDCHQQERSQHFPEALHFGKCQWTVTFHFLSSEMIVAMPLSWASRVSVHHPTPPPSDGQIEGLRRPLRAKHQAWMRTASSCWLCFWGPWLPCVLLSGSVSHLGASEPGPIPKWLCSWAPFPLQISDFHLQNEAGERKKSEPLELKKKKNFCTFLLLPKSYLYLWLLSRQSKIRQQNQSSDILAETWLKSVWFVVLLLLGDWGRRQRMQKS